MSVCDFDFCVYQENGTCILSSVDINDTGMCDSAIVIDLPKEVLYLRKKEILAKLKNHEDAWDKNRFEK